MNKKEIGEIRRRQRRDRSNMTAVYGCYVRDSKEIISEFKASMGTLPENEAEKYMSLFKKTLSGALGKKLNNLTFTTAQVANKDPRHAALMDLRKCTLKDQEQRTDMYRRIIDSLQMDSNYLILLGCDTYDVPFKSKDDENQADVSDETFTYIICAICPVKETKPNLHYVHDESTFHDGGNLQAVNSPTLGFMFPSFDNRSTNIYSALYFNKNTADGCEPFVEAILGAQAPSAPDSQKAVFDALLRSTLEDECSIDVVQMIHEQAIARVELHKESRNPEPLTVDRNEIKSILASSGVSAEKANAFANAFEQTFGAGAEVVLQNIIDTQHYSVTAPDVVIKIAPDRAQNIEMRTIGGVNYVMILADGDVEVNGVQISPPSVN